MRSVLKNLCVVQARMSSSRLPGKVLLPAGSISLLELLLDRLSKSVLVDEVILATSTDHTDDVFEEMNLGVKIFRGDLRDVRSRFIRIAETYEPQNIVRITADCPLTCWDLLDQILDRHQKSGVQYTSNSHQYGHPKGFDIEVFQGKLLLQSDFLTKEDYDKEHVTPWMFKSGKLEVDFVEFVSSNQARQYNFSIDTISDYEFFCRLNRDYPVQQKRFIDIWRFISSNSGVANNCQP